MGNEGGERWRWARGKAYCLERKCTFTIVNRPSCNDKGKKRKEERKKRSSRFHRNISLSLSISDVNISRETFFKNSSPLHLSSKLFFWTAESSSLWSSRRYRKSVSSRQYWRSARFAFSPLFIRGWSKLSPTSYPYEKLFAEKRMALGISIFRGKVNKVINKLWQSYWHTTSSKRRRAKLDTR